MTWFLNLGKAVAKALVSEVPGLLQRILPTKRPKRAPTELDSRGVAIQNRASHVPEAHKVTGCCPFVRSGRFHGEDCYELGREDCTPLKRGRKPLRVIPTKRYDDD